MSGLVRVRVEFLGPFEFTFGTTAAEVTLDGPATVLRLLETMAVQSEAARALHRTLCDPDSPRRPYYYVSIDYSVVAPEAVLQTPLHDGARVCFAMPMAGG